MSGIWTFDSVSFTFDDISYHFWDGLELTSDDIWTFDADHFTFDDVLHHTWDGWHDDTSIVEEIASHGSGGLKKRISAQDVEYFLLVQQRKAEDEFLMKLITEFLDKAA